jgi:D-alanyl-D-alanine dipeptidase
MKELDTTLRRSYWTAQMEEAFEFMETMRAYPVQENGETLASLTEAVEAAGVDVRFSTSKIVLDFDRVFFLRTSLIPDFLAIARAMNERDWILKVEDGYRSTTMQKHLALKPNVFDTILKRTIWECDDAIPSAELLFRRVTALCATAPKVGTHISASAIDISVLHRADETEVDRGGDYLELSERTPMESPFISEEALRNRLEIKDLMESHGFMAYPYEFWHFSKGDAYDEYMNRTGAPARYGAIHWDEGEQTITPVVSPELSLHSTEDIKQAIAGALERLTAAKTA